MGEDVHQLAEDHQAEDIQLDLGQLRASKQAIKVELSVVRWLSWTVKCDSSFKWRGLEG